jgi:hypothetical protein
MVEGVRISQPPRFNRLGQESQTGGWVKYENYEKDVADLHRRADVLAARLAEANVRADQAEERCEHLIALMAAHGSVGSEMSAAQPKENGPPRP